MGAMLGSAFGQTAHGLLPGLTAPAGAYALVGMGAVFAGAARAPITAVLIIFELTNDYSIILPLMLAIVVATSLSTRLSPETIYTLKLRRRGITMRPRVVSVMRTVPVGDAMSAMPAALAPDAPLAESRRALRRERATSCPCVDADGRLTGVVSALAVEEQAVASLRDGSAPPGSPTPRRSCKPTTRSSTPCGRSPADEPALPVVAANGPRSLAGSPIATSCAPTTASARG